MLTVAEPDAPVDAVAEGLSRVSKPALSSGAVKNPSMLSCVLQVRNGKETEPSTRALSWEERILSVPGLLAGVPLLPAGVLLEGAATGMALKRPEMDVLRPGLWPERDSGGNVKVKPRSRYSAPLEEPFAPFWLLIIAPAV